MNFCAYVWCTFLYLLFECNFPGVLHFLVCNCCCYFLLNCQNSAAFFSHVTFLHFSSCYHMCCAQLFICLLAWFFGFRYCMNNWKLALFFAVLLRTASLISAAIMLTFACCCVLQILVDAISSGFVAVLPLCLRFRCFGGFWLLIFRVPFSFHVWLWSFDVFFATFVSILFNTIYALR